MPLHDTHYGDEIMLDINLIREKHFDCIVLDLLLPDANGLEIIKEMESEKQEHFTALIVYSAKDLTDKEKTRLNQFANRIILKTSNSILWFCLL